MQETATERDSARETPGIAVSGATGYVGVHLVHELLQRGHAVTALLRKSSAARDREVLTRHGATLAEIDLDTERSVTEALQGAQVLVHLIGSIAPPRGTRFADLHTGLAGRFFTAARSAGVQRLVVLTALGAAPDAASQYHRTKWQMEQAARDSGLPHLIIRPSLIVGRAVGHRDSKIVRRYLELIRTRSKVPLVRGGTNRIQPVSVTDVARACTAAALDADADGRVCELGGDEILTTRAFVERLMQTVGMQKPITTLPGPVAFTVASVLELVQTVPLISRDQVKIAGVDGTCQQNALTNRFGIVPQPLDEALSVYRSESTTGHDEGR